MKRIFPFVLATVTFVIGLGIGSIQPLFSIPSAQQPIESATTATSTASVLIDYGVVPGKKIIAYRVDASATTTVLSALQDIAARQGFAVAATDYGASGKLVTGVDDVINDAANNSFWQYWVNSQYAPVAADAFSLKPGDVVMWKYVVGDRSGSAE
jgi:hypothetical protein